jgi:DNA adenine methylase
MLSPLRYPGGKSRAVKQLLQFFPCTAGTLVSPFFGGGSVELALADRGWRVLGFDLFGPLVDFWQQALTDAVSLADEVSKHHPLTFEGFKKLQRTTDKLPTQLERAAAFYVVNRSSFCGTTCSGGMSPGHERFNINSIERLRHFSAPNAWVEKADFKVSIVQHEHGFVFADPPYLQSRRLYGNGGDLHDDFDHEALRDLLRERERWILCYDDCRDVRYLYGGFRIVPLEWKYGMSRDKNSNEVVILSNDLPVPCTLCANRLAQPTPLQEVLAELYRKFPVPTSETVARR